MNLERRLGPASLRLWGLILNFLANVLLLYGAVGFVSDGSRGLALGVGLVVTVACIGVLSTPRR